MMIWDWAVHMLYGTSRTGDQLSARADAAVSRIREAYDQREKDASTTKDVLDRLNEQLRRARLV